MDFGIGHGIERLGEGGVVVGDAAFEHGAGAKADDFAGLGHNWILVLLLVPLSTHAEHQGIHEEHKDRGMIHFHPKRMGKSAGDFERIARWLIIRYRYLSPFRFVAD